MYCCTLNLEPNTPPRPKTGPPLLWTCLRFLPSLFYNSSGVCTALRVKSSFPISTSFHSRKFCTTVALFCTRSRCVYNMSLVSTDAVGKKRLPATSSKARAQRVVRLVAKHFVLGEKQSSLAPLVKIRSLSSTLGESRRLRVHCRRKSSRRHRELDCTPLSQKTRLLSSPHGHKVGTPVLESAALSKVKAV